MKASTITGSGQAVKADAAGAGRGQLVVGRHPAEAEQGAQQNRHRQRQLQEAGHDVTQQPQDLERRDPVIDHHLDQLEQAAHDQRKGEYQQSQAERTQHLAEDIKIQGLESIHLAVA